MADHRVQVDHRAEGLGSRDPTAEDVFALYAPLLASLRSAGHVDQQFSMLVDEAVGVWRRPGFDTFLSVPGLRFTPFDYQLQAARSALRRMRGRAILADEVGLGKTIEAGLILAELRLRGLADRTLVISPAGLVTQWQEELERKFGVPTVLASRAAGPATTGTATTANCHHRTWQRGTRRRGPAGAGRLTARRAPGSAEVRADRRPVGPDRRRRGTPGTRAAQRLREADTGAALPSFAAADGDSGREPAAGSVRAGEPGRAWPAGHRGAVPGGARRARCRAELGAEERGGTAEADRRGDDPAPAQRGKRAAAAAPGGDTAR